MKSLSALADFNEVKEEKIFEGNPRKQNSVKIESVCFFASSINQQLQRLVGDGCKLFRDISYGNPKNYNPMEESKKARIL